MVSISMRPEEIEQESFRIIDAEAEPHGWPDAEWGIIRRVIHTSADFDYARTMILSNGVIKAAIASIRGGDGIATDTTMALSGISKARLLPFGCRVTCHVADPDVAEIARQASITRSIAAMRKAVAAPANRIFVIGNAPTALFELMRLIDDGHVVPSLIIGLPVGFVGAEESKNSLASIARGIPYITNTGRKGGSNVAAAVVNALAIMAAEQPA